MRYLPLITSFALAMGPGFGLSESHAETAATATAGPEIPFETFELDNGLKVIVHVDNSLPLVAVNLDYRVGSADEPPGRSGFAHLFEHLMFMGTSKVPRGAFDTLMEAEGASNNAWTSNDRTNYYETGPSHTLPLLLWLEADRLASLGRNIDQEKLDLQRDVVRNERRQGIDNAPYGDAWVALPEMLFAKGHPYHHSVIGSHADLEAATVADVQDFFARWYVPNNASLVVAGDVDRAEVEALVRKTFGWIPKGEPPRKEAVTPMPRQAPVSTAPRTIEDTVDQARVYLAWTSPAHYQPGDAALDVLASVLADGKTSKLQQALVYQSSIAQDVAAAQWSGLRGSRFMIYATGRDGISAEDLQAKLSKAVADALASIDDDDIARAKTKIRKTFFTGLESLLGRAMLLNGYQTSVGEPGYLQQDLARYTSLDLAAVKAVAAEVMQPEFRVVLRIVPEPKPADANSKEGQ